jgi:hypothetical protein
MQQVVVFGSPEGVQMSGLFAYELRVDGKPLFSENSLRTILRKTAGPDQNLPNRKCLAHLAESLNDLAARYFLRKSAPDYLSKHDDLCHALGCIEQWLTDRGLAEESATRQAFDALVDELEKSEIDPTGQATHIWPKAVNWKGKDRGTDGGMDVARICADWLNLALSESGQPMLGHSNDGPLARFVGAIIPLIVGETVTTGNISQHLKRSQRARMAGTKS